MNALITTPAETTEALIARRDEISARLVELEEIHDQFASKGIVGLVDPEFREISIEITSLHIERLKIGNLILKAHDSQSISIKREPTHCGLTEKDIVDSIESNARVITKLLPNLEDSLVEFHINDADKREAAGESTDIAGLFLYNITTLGPLLIALDDVRERKGAM